MKTFLQIVALVVIVAMSVFLAYCLWVGYIPRQPGPPVYRSTQAFWYWDNIAVMVVMLVICVVITVWDHKRRP